LKLLGSFGKVASTLAVFSIQGTNFEVENNRNVMGDDVLVNPPVDRLAPGSDSDNDVEEEGPWSNAEEADDDESLMMDVPLMEYPGELAPKKLEAPPEGMSWKESAILECMDLALKSHEDDHPLKAFVWKSPLEDEEEYIADSIKEWIPKSLSLPVWAVDPCVGTLVSHIVGDEQESGEGEMSVAKGAD
jgi:hypothetical protein